MAIDKWWVNIADLKPEHFFKNVVNPGIAIPFHLLYFLVGLRETIAAYGPAI